MRNLQSYARTLFIKYALGPMALQVRQFSQRYTISIQFRLATTNFDRAQKYLQSENLRTN